MRVFWLEYLWENSFILENMDTVSVQITRTCTLQNFWADISFNKPTSFCCGRTFMPVARQTCDFGYLVAARRFV